MYYGLGRSKVYRGWLKESKSYWIWKIRGLDKVEYVRVGVNLGGIVEERLV